MMENISMKDKIIRYVLGIILWVSGIVIAVQSSEVLGSILILLALILILTGLFNFCPIYKLIGISTRKETVTPMSE